MLPRTHLAGRRSHKTKLFRPPRLVERKHRLVRRRVNLHVQCTLGLGCFLVAAVANHSAALGQAQVEGQQGAVLHADGPQGGAIDLQAGGR